MAEESGTSIDDLTAEEHEILEYLLQNEQQGKPAQPGIPLCDRNVESPLSFGQLRMWLVHELNKEQSSPYDNLSFGLRIRGALNTEALQSSLAEIVRRHEVLRTTFVLKDDEPVQVVADAGPEPELKDLSRLPESERECRVHELLQEAKGSLLDLATGPLFKPQLIRLTSTDYVLVIIIHHIINDAWSNGIFIRELKILYECFDQGRPSPLQELPIQYRDFSQWQRDWLQGDRLKNYLDYWTEQLADLPVLELPLDRQRPPVQTFNGAVQTMPLSRELSVALADLSKNHGVTLFMTMLSALGILLQRYGRQDDIGIGTAIANRDREELQGLIGLFLNMLVMRLDLSGDPSIADLLERVKDTAMSAYAHQHLPFEKLVEAMQLDRDSNRTPLFQISLTMLDAEDMRPFHIDNLEVSPIAASGHTARFDLEVYVFQSSADLSLNFTYNTDLFEAATIERMLGHYQALLEGLVADPNRRISELPMLSAGEWHQLVEWNRTAADYPQDKTVHELFERQAMANPDAVAIEHDGETLSYRELNQRANRLAHYLTAAGVKPNAAVAVLMERTPDLVIAQLAVLKAGAAYVAIDPDSPVQRLAFILEDTRSPVLLTQTSLSEKAQGYPGRILCLDSDADILSEQSNQNPAVAVTAKNLVYVIYTSGSTGTPKGVEVPHGGLMNLVSWHRRAYEVSPADRATHLAGLGFDASVWELWPYLTSGASLYLVSDERRLEPANLWSWMAVQGITLSFLPTPLAEAVLREPVPDGLKLRVLLTGGDRLHGGLVNKPLPFRVVNHYGPTENSVVVTFAEVDVCAREDPPIGRPIDNVQTYILDKDLQPVPVGVWGELCIGGDGLARGYLNQPELTAEKFILNPFSEAAAARLYRSGDLVRYREDGQIEFRGRVDHQVKVRGFRLELGEIETVLGRHEAVQDAVVLMHEDETGAKRLVAYVVPEKGSVPTLEALHQHVRSALPEYMLPSAFVFLEELPLTPNGKVDRVSLPMPDDLWGNPGAEYTAPRNELEQQLARIWAEVLKLDRVGIHDNFFNLGGHSLIATRVTSRIRQNLKLDLPLSQVFSYPTVAELASVVKPLMIENAEDEANVIVAVKRKGALPLSFAQERLWFLEQLEPGSPSYNIPLVVRLRGGLNVAALEGSINAVIQRHEPLRTTFAMVGNIPQQCINERLELALKVENLRDLPEQDCENVLLRRTQEEARLPFDLATGPLIRVGLLQTRRDEHVLLLTMHHIVSDGWSMKIFFDELAELYKAYKSGRSASLPELPIRYADYSSWQRNRLQGETLERQLAYWKQRLVDLPVLELPTDHPRLPVPTFRGGSEKWSLAGSLLDELRNFCRGEDTTLFMVMLTTFSLLLQRYSSQDDIVVGSPIAGRNRQEIEGLIGFFLNSLVLRCDLSDDPPFSEAVHRMREVAVEAFEHQDLPFEKLVEEMHPERDMSRNPLFQVMFNFMDLAETRLELADLQAEFIGEGMQATKFDLTLYAFEQPDRLYLSFDYSLDLFEAETIREMQGHLCTLLEAVVSDPQCRLSRLPLLSEAQHRQQEHTGNAVGPTEPFEEIQAAAIEDTIPAMFAQRVRAGPEQMAVITRNHQWTYRELELESERIAWLIQQSEGDDWERIALLFNHDAPMLAGLIAVLKTGKAYVPLDPTMPLARLERILDDAQVSAIVAEERWLGLARQLGDGLAVISTDAVCDTKEVVSAKRTPDSLAYLLYTSGSTGEPKGVMQNDRNLLHHVRAYKNSLHLRTQDRLTLFSSYTFDAAIMDIFGALLSGATLYPVDVRNEETEALCAWISERAITVFHSTPTVYRHFLSQMNEGDKLSTVRIVVLGGEPVFREDVDHYKDHFSAECLFVNGLGPTESTTALQYWIDHDTALVRNAVPVGYPVLDTEILLLDKFGEPTDILGEIAICSPYVALGYWRQPELTREKFGTDENDSRIRIYRTGDLGRRRANGGIEFVGRKDQQLKLRGYRIEAGEVEAALCRHDAVERAAVVLTEVQDAERQLIAYLVCKDGISVDMGALRTYLEAAIPSYMIPAWMVQLDDLPMTVGGKLDRRQLPAPDPDLQSVETYTAPTTEVESSLTDIWEEVLSIDKVGIYDDFFRLGGHSLLAIKAVNKINKTFESSLSLARFMTLATVKKLADELQKADLTSDTKPLLARVDLSVDGETYPLSSAQERIWYIRALYPEVGGAYNIQLIIQLDAGVSKVEAILKRLQQQHAILRTTYALDGAELVQKVNQTEMPALDVIDISDFSEAEIKHKIAQYGKTFFDLETGPIWHCAIVKRDDRALALSITINHIASDGWSLNILKQEILRLCQQERIETEITRIKPGIQYIDYALWHREQLDESRLEVLQTYWSQKLSGICAAIDLPIDKTRPPVYSYSGALEFSALSAAQSNDLRQFARETKVTLYMLMLAVFKLLLSRYAQQSDVVVGTPVSGRTLPEMDDIIGLFVDTLVLRTDLTGSQSFARLLKNVRETTLDAFEHQDLPFDKIVEIVQPERDLSRNPVFQVMFSFLVPEEGPKRKSEALDEEIQSSDAAGSQVDLTLVVKYDDSQLVIGFEYNDDLFEVATIRQMMTHYRRLLKLTIAAPESPIDQLEMLDDEEKDLILHRWNQTHADFVQGETLHSLIEQQVQRSPQAIAVRFEQHALDYSELDQKANDIACLLLAKNVEPGQFVGVYLERSMDLVAAVLGVLKAGAAYVPLDPEYPQERLNYMVADANIRVLLSQEKFENCVPSGVTDVIYLDSSQLYEAVKPQVFPVVTEDMSAYVIYTSGSTGKPKGVMVSHRAVVNHACWMQNLFKYDQTDRVLLKAALSFDASVCEIFDPLLIGACVVVTVPGGHRDSEYLIQTVRKDKITSLLLTPSELRMLLLSLTDPAALSTLKQIGCGGEALSPELLQAYYEKCTTPLYNLYGPTESTIDATSFLCEANFNNDNIPIGTPVSNSCAYILDQQLQPVPIGVYGELHIGGAGLAQGYLNQPELTAEKFIADPFSDDPAARLYKTGDRARYRRDGAIEFLGRIDHQVKLRGFRIELGEIESVLSDFAGIAAAVVVIREDQSEEQRLVAYLVSQDGETSSHYTDLSAYLEQRLPQYMVPSSLQWLDEFPLTPNGKINYRALPAPTGSIERDTSDIVEPRDEVEQKISDIWQQFLNLDLISVKDNFFTLGGHSLLAVKVVGHINADFNISISFAKFMELSTVEKVSSYINEIRDRDETSQMYPSAPLQALVDVSIDGKSYPLSSAQERFWYIYKLYPDVPAHNVQMHASVSGSIDKVRSALELIQQRHAILRTTYTLENAQSAQIIHSSMPLALTHIDVTDSAEKGVEKRIRDQLNDSGFRAFNLETGPIWRCSIVQQGELLNLFFTIHHIAIDGWSINILKQELQQLCLRDDFEIVKNNLTPAIQYVDYTLWQSEQFETGRLEKLQAYWQQTLAGISSVIELPTDKPRPPVYGYSGAIEHVALSKPLSKDLRQFSRKNEMTLFMVMLATFNVLLSRYSQQSDIVVGTPVSGRTVPETNNIIGLFVNSLVLRSELSATPTFNALLKQVRETTLAAFEHHDLPFEKLVEMLQPERDLSRNPIFQVMFSFLIPEYDLDKETNKEPADLSEEIESSAAAGAQVDISLVVKDEDSQLVIGMIYNTDLFEASTIRQMLDHYRRLLASSIASADSELGQLAMLSDEEEQLMLYQWNQTSTDYPLDKAVHELFEAQAAATPDAVAVDYEGDTLSYAQLNERANRLAHFLQARGVGPEVMVGLFMERSLEMIVGLLGILKAGGAYVPLDLDYPQPRIAFMLEDSAVPVLLIQAGLRERLPEYSGELVCVDTDWPTIALESTANPESNASADNLAYVIYTSGSTGQPKGVEIQHRAINRLVRNTDYFQVESTDRVVQASNISFDAATFELWGALLNGAQLIGISKDVLLEPRLLASFLQQQRISAMFLTTALFNQIARKVPDAFSGLRGLMFGGEAVEPGAVCQVLTHSPPELLLHVYGPTESTTFASWYRVEGISDAATTVPIGRPLANTTLYILDKHRNPVPLGVPGELYIGGNGLARGYLNQPELTAEKFVANPFGASADERLYRTGDKVRYRCDGAIEFMGRFDHQIKLRGFRIELGEIETLLNQHEAVKDTIVMLREDRPGEKRLVAYIVEQQPTAGPDVLRQYVRSALPEYMLPSVFVTLDELPLSANGKVDRKLLPLPPRVQKHAKDLNNKPESEMEIIMARIWEELLDIDDIETSDMFFDLGGHSLLTLKVVDRFARETNIRIPPASLITQTLRQLAAAAETSAMVSEKGSGNGVLGKIKRKLTRRE